MTDLVAGLSLHCFLLRVKTIRDCGAEIGF